MTTTKPTHCYVGRATCGHIRAVIIDDPKNAKNVAKFCGQMIRDGLAVERMTVVAFKADESFASECETCAERQKPKRKKVAP